MVLFFTSSLSRFLRLAEALVFLSTFTLSTFGVGGNQSSSDGFGFFLVRVFLPLSETEDTELEVISIFGIGILGSFSFLNFGAGNCDPASIFIFGASSSLKISNFGGAGRFRGSFFRRVFVVEFSLRVRVLEVVDFDLET